MTINGFVNKRQNRLVSLEHDLVVVGGGMTGVVCAITAAREGLRVALVQDRPVLGGNASSEVRIWMLGATSHMANNNRWSREGGLVDELMTENLFRNKEGNPVFYDALLLDKVISEPGIDLFLNTAVFEVGKSDGKTVSNVRAFNPQNSTEYIFNAPLFADCSGDGIVAYLAGASFRTGAEDKEEFGERFIEDKLAFGEALGHTIIFYTKRCSTRVDYHAPDFAIKDIDKKTVRIADSGYFNVEQQGCKYWWIEYGGRLDTVHDTEKIKYELWGIVYGIWDHIKNSGKYPQADNLSLEWVGVIPGKRESRRFSGLYTLTQGDIISQNQHYDAVAHGGWSIDLHPADGIYSSLRACNQWHSKGVYQIPYRCYVSRDIENLFLGGRLISVSHVANGSTRVMCTCACGGEVIGTSAALCARGKLLPADFAEAERVGELQRALVEKGHYIPFVNIPTSPSDLLGSARVRVSSTLRPESFGPSNGFAPLSESAAALFPLSGRLPRISLRVRSSAPTSLEAQLRTSSKPGNYTPDETVGAQTFSLEAGESVLDFDFDFATDRPRYLFLCLMRNDKVEVELASGVLSGIATVYNTVNPSVSNYGRQSPPEGIGIEEFEFWCPRRIPQDSNIALRLDSPLEGFGSENLRVPVFRPVDSPNCWSADWDDASPWVELSWDGQHRISGLRLFFDPDYDQALESVQMGHHSNVSAHTVRRFRVEDAEGNVLAAVEGNHNAVCDLSFGEPVLTDRLVIRFERPGESTPVSVFGLLLR